MLTSKPSNTTDIVLYRGAINLSQYRLLAHLTTRKLYTAEQYNTFTTAVACWNSGVTLHVGVDKTYIQ